MIKRNKANVKATIFVVKGAFFGEDHLETIKTEQMRKAQTA